jgi:methionyl-tRNA formyltransferase
MKIAFFGTSDRSTAILDKLHENFDLQFCLTKNPTKRGRKQIVTKTEVHQWAEKNEVPLITVDSLDKSESLKVKNTLENYGIELVIAADFSFIIPPEIFTQPRLGIVNAHFSLLPKLRGASPVQHAILEGFEKTGVTFHLVAEGMDTGKIIYRIEYDLLGKETSEELYEKLFHLTSETVSQVINDYAREKLKPYSQDESLASYCRSKSHPKSTYIFKEDAKINWDDDLKMIEREIRAYQPWPVAWTTLGNLAENPKLADNFKLKNSLEPKLTVKLHRAKILNGLLKPLEVQVEGKNIIDWESFLNGYAA